MKPKLSNKFIFLAIPLASVTLALLLASCGAEPLRQKAAPCEEGSNCSNQGAPAKSDTGNASQGDSPKSPSGQSTLGGSIAGKPDGSGNSAEIKLDGCSKWNHDEKTIPGTNTKIQLIQSKYWNFADAQEICKNLVNGPWRMPKGEELKVAQEAKAFGNMLNSLKEFSATQKRNTYCGIWVGEAGANSTTGAQGFLFSAYPPGAGSSQASATANLTAVQKTDRLAVVCIKE